MNRLKKLITLLMVAIMLGTAFPETAAVLSRLEIVEAATIKISQKKVTLTKWQKKVLAISGTKKKVKWSSTDNSVVSVNEKGVIAAKKKGTAVIIAKVNNKKYKCTVTVKNPKICGSAKFYISLPNKYSRLSYSAGGFDKTTEVRIYIDNKLAEKFKGDYPYAIWYIDGGPGIKLTKNQLKKGTHTVELVQLVSTTKNFKILNYKKAQYKIP